MKIPKQKRPSNPSPETLKSYKEEKIEPANLIKSSKGKYWKINLESPVYTIVREVMQENLNSNRTLRRTQDVVKNQGVG